RRRHTRFSRDWSSDVCSSDLGPGSGIRTLDTESCHGESTADDDACYRETEVTTVTSPVNVVARGWIDLQNHRSLSRPAPLKPGRSEERRVGKEAGGRREAPAQ